MGLGVKGEIWYFLPSLILDNTLRKSAYPRAAVLSVYVVCFDFSLDIDDLHLKTL